MSGDPANPPPPAAGSRDGTHRRDSLRNQIALAAGAIMLALLLLAILATAGFARHQTLRNATAAIRADAQEAARRAADILHGVEVTCAGIADTATDGGLDPGQLTTMLRAMVRATPGATGTMLAMEPVRPGEPYYARRIALDGNDSDFIALNYLYKSQRWYKRTLASDKGWWSEPYFNEAAGNVWTITYNMPIRQPGRGGRNRGMVSMDILLEEMESQVGALHPRPGRQVAVIAPDGLIATHPEPGVARDYTLARYIAQLGRGDLRPLAEAARLRRPLAYRHTDPRNGVRWFTAAEPIGATGGSVALSQNYSTIIAHLNQVLGLVVAVGLVAALACTLAVRRLARRVSRPLEDLADAAGHLARGQFYWAVPHTTRPDEVGLLARALATARSSIQRQMLEIREMAAAQQKLDSELSIARDIQQSMVPPPRRFVHGDCRALDVHATLEPAKEVGGDFYGYHVADGAFWFGIGDVSDKGIPAALFMARSDAILKTASNGVDTPSQALAVASPLLAEGNDACMFITTLIGRIDLASGDCMLASAGHDPPLLLHADGRVERLDFDNGPPLGFEISDDFPLWRGRLEPGDSLVAWTDGVTEAFNLDNEAFGEERLVAALRAGYSARENCSRLVAEVHAFAGKAPQSDDITVLAIRRETAAPAADKG